MEKCSFCVQRIMEAKSEALRKTEPDGSPRQPSNLAEVEAAEKEGKQLQAKYIRDGEVRTACQTTCPAEAIEFGDMNDPNSRVRKAYEDPRNYSCLVEVGTQPAVTYQTKVRNAVRAS
jgi:molybdopterin-containing oxidoreductase family iron-sulfur binding subunit